MQTEGKMSYSILLDEEQRALIVAALGYLSRPSDEAKLLLQMLQEIPEVEASSPGILHGLCL